MVGRSTTYQVPLGIRTSATLGNLSIGDEYFIYLKAVGTSGIESASSGTFFYTPPPGPSTFPSPTPAPVISRQPEDEVIREGETVELKVVATGDAPLLYRWHKDGVLIPGATSDSLVIESADLVDSGLYAVLVFNSAGASLSSRARLIVRPRLDTPPSIEPISDATIHWGQPFITDVTIRSSNTPLELLAVEVESSNPTLVTGSIQFLRCETGLHELQVMPIAARTGTATITVRAVDAGGRFSGTSFKVSVHAPPSPVTLTVKAKLSTKAGRPIAPEPVYLSAPEGFVEEVVLTGESLNPELIPSESILFSGSGSVRQMVAVPSAGASGTARLIVHATLGDLTTSQEVEVTIFPKNTAPFILGFPSEITLLAGQVQSFQFEVEDPEGDPVTTVVLTNPWEFSSLVQFEGIGNIVTVTLSALPGQVGTFELTAVAQDFDGLFAVANGVATILSPSLSIERSGDQLVIRWSQIDGVRLEFATALEDGWHPVSALPTTMTSASGELRVDISSASTVRFFRIITPVAPGVVQQ